MTIALTKNWTVERFLTWAAAQEERYEFDGIRPVAMNGSSANHNRIMTNIHASLRARLRGTPCSYFGPDLGVRIGEHKIRYPDALITCTRFPGSERIAPDVVIVFEIISPDSGRRDRFEKVRDYAAVPSIRRYIIVESNTCAVLVLHRAKGEADWTTLPLTDDDIVALPEVGIDCPIAEFYEDVEFTDPDTAAGGE